MSPYRVSLTELVTRFGTTPERKTLLRGFLNYRVKMKSLGFSDGFQWIDGSFVEDIESTMQRPPADIDLVTFSALPGCINSEEDWDQFLEENQVLFEPELSKGEFLCDPYYINIHTHPIYLIQQTRYWFGLFTHQRSTSLWKGILEIDLAEDETEALKFVTEGGNDHAS